MNRTQFEIYRESEYFNIKELEAQTGQSYRKFADVMLKELVDNALDACETSGVVPEIGIHIEGFKYLSIGVSDNGNGIDTETIERILNYQTRTSDKQAYRSPTRGAQGNALKTVFGIPFALSGEDRDKTHPVIIQSRNIKHTMLLWLDPTGKVRTEIKRENIDFPKGTEITTRIPGKDQEFDPEQWIKAFSLFNPHATIKFTRISDEINHVKSSDENEGILKNSDFEKNNHVKSFDEKPQIFKATVDFPNKWKKYIPTNPTSPWWYGESDMKKLIFAYICEIEQGRLKDIKLRDYLKQFKGLTGTKTGIICSKMDDIKMISDFKTKPNRISDLWEIMKSLTKNPSYKTLGMVGEDHFKQFFDCCYGICRPMERLEPDHWGKEGPPDEILDDGAYHLVDGKHYTIINEVYYEVQQPQFWYRSTNGEDNGIPFFFEVAIALTEKMGEFFHGANFSPTYEDPFSTTSFECKEFGEFNQWDGIKEFLRRAHAFPDSEDGIKTTVAIHLVCPTLHWTERGKSRLTNIE